MKGGLISLFTALLLFVTSLVFVACKKSSEGVEPVVIDLTEVTIEGETLLEYMYAMEEEGEIEFSLSNGMITAINGTENAATYNPCWMLYTSDTEYSNGAWGSYEHERQTLFSATLGASELPAKSGEIYVWVYQSF